MNSANAANLAWDLADAVRTFTRRQKRLTTSALIGAGAYSDAIEQLLKLFIDAGVALSADLSLEAHHWVDGYLGCDNEPTLRELVKVAASPDPRRNVCAQVVVRPHRCSTPAPADTTNAVA